MKSFCRVCCIPEKRPGSISLTGLACDLLPSWFALVPHNLTYQEQIGEQSAKMDRSV